VFGGYNLLVMVKGVGSYMQLGTTLDDALGV
jgi:tRNA A37 threonylcarbamoyltransferase TsaD